MYAKTTNAFKLFLASVTGGLLIMADAFYNGYPLFYSDSHEYMTTAFQGKILDDHASAYGYFIKVTSLNGLSLWPVVFCQSLILSWLILLTVKAITGSHKFMLKGLSAILLLSLFTGMSWTACQVMPDIFTSIAFLALFLIVFSKQSKATSVLLYLVFILAVAMHLSHIVVFSLVLAFILIAGKLFIYPGQKKRNIIVLALLAITFLEVYPMQYPLNRTKYITFMGAMVEQGIAQKYLHEYGGKNYAISRYKDSLNGLDGVQFLFNPKSPFTKLGGWSRVTELNSEFKDIALGTLLSPEYIYLHTLASVKQTAKQLNTFDICDGNWSFNDTNGIIYSLILKYTPQEANQFYQGRQSQVNFAGVPFLKILYRLVEWCSAVLVIIVLIFFRRKMNIELKIASWLFVVMVIINDWDLSTFSSVTNRYGCRIAWLIPFLAILYFYRWREIKSGIADTEKKLIH